MWNINLKVHHIRGTLNVEAVLLSRLYSGKSVDQVLLTTLLKNFIWDKVEAHHLQLNLSV